MGLFRWLFQLFSGNRPTAPPQAKPSKVEKTRPRKAAKLLPRIWKRVRESGLPGDFTSEQPYRFARRAIIPPAFIGRGKKGYYDLAGDIDVEKLRRWSLPELATPDDLASWLDLPIGKVAWLTGRFEAGKRPPSAQSAHYIFTWKAKRKGGARLIESPKPLLREVQTRVLREILERVPPHPAAHGFAKGRSILTNARPHCGHAVVIKWDLADFYTSIRHNRVVAIFRSLGYSREASLWLAAVTTSAVPADLPLPESTAHALKPYLSRHLPQGAPTSPALANLSAYGLDVRLAGLARAFGGVYTRYADDLTISGDRQLTRNLKNLIPLVEKIIQSERFRVHPSKRRVLRQTQRQTVAGVVVNRKPNVNRRDFDRLKATLCNAAKHGAASQNHESHPDFRAHLRGKIAHVTMLNPDRGARLLRIFERIDFNR